MNRRNLFKSVYLYKEGKIAVLDDFDPSQAGELPAHYTINFGFMGLCTRGHMNIVCDKKPCSFHQGDFFIITPHTELTVKDITSKFNVRAIALSRHFAHSEMYRKSIPLNDLIQFVRLHPVISLSKNNIRFFNNAFAQLTLTITSQNHTFQKDLILGQMSTISSWVNSLISYHLGLEPVSLKRTDQLFMNFLDLVTKEFKKHHDLKFYADRLCVTTKYLTIVSKNASKQTASRWIDFFIMNEAKLLLRSSHMSILQIASELGYPNQSCFGKAFKKENGCTPSEFRFR